MDLSGGYPLWLITNGLPAGYPKPCEDAGCEVLIMGGGISGALVAHALLQEGTDCILIDSRTVGLGSTCASTALLQYELDLTLSELAAQIGYEKAARAYTLCSTAIDQLEEIARAVQEESFTRSASLFYAAEKKHVADLEKEADLRAQSGFDVQWLDEKKIRSAYGFAAPGAILSAQGATVNAYLFMHALLREGVKKGLRVFDRTAAKEIKYSKSGVEVHTGNGKVLKAAKIVNATGYEAVQQIGKKIASLHSTYVVASENLEEGKAPWKEKVMLWNTADPYLYFRMTDDYRVIAGGRDEKFYNPEMRDRMLDKKSKQLTKDVLALFPGSGFVPEFRWTGTFAITPDSLPYIGTHSRFPHTYFALGYGGNGIAFSQVAAVIIKDLLSGKENPDAKLFAFDR